MQTCRLPGEGAPLNCERGLRSAPCRRLGAHGAPNIYAVNYEATITKMNRKHLKRVRAICIKI